jgi:hypothetical protein
MIIEWDFLKERPNPKKYFRNLSFEKIEDYLNYFINTGIEITTYTGEAQINNFAELTKKGPSKLNYYDDDMMSLYLAWKSGIRNLLKEHINKFQNEYYFFCESNTVPVGFLPPFKKELFPNDEKGIRWLKNIQIETKNELKVLREIKEKNNITKLYVTKKDGDFFYNGVFINMSKNTDCYKIFCSLYDLIPNGGEITYKELIEHVKSILRKTKSYSFENTKRIIQKNLTEKNSGLRRYINYDDNSKPLLLVHRGKGIIFNNKP